MVRGFPLDEQCKEFGELCREVDGDGDPRIFCTGYSNDAGDVQTFCAECKAYVKNVTPWKGERNGVLPGQISIDELLADAEEQQGVPLTQLPEYDSI